VGKWLEENNLTAFTIFFDIIKQSGFPCMPFMRAGIAMARAIGYAGEGDVLTACMAALTTV